MSDTEEAAGDEQAASNPNERPDFNEDGFPVIYCTPGTTPLVDPIMFEFERGELEEGEKVRGAVRIMAWPLRGPKEVIDVALDGPKPLVTLAAWNAMTLDERMTAEENGAVAPGQIVSTDMTKVLPAETLAWLEAWQYLVNTGAVWHAAGVVGEYAMRLIERGFLAYGPRRVPGAYHPVLGRHDVPAGEKGHLAYIGALMGPEYREWVRTRK